MPTDPKTRGKTDSTCQLACHWKPLLRNLPAWRQGVNQGSLSWTGHLMAAVNFSAKIYWGEVRMSSDFQSFHRVNSIGSLCLGSGLHGEFSHPGLQGCYSCGGLGWTHLTLRSEPRFIVCRATAAPRVANFWNIDFPEPRKFPLICISPPVINLPTKPSDCSSRGQFISKIEQNKLKASSLDLIDKKSFFHRAN